MVRQMRVLHERTMGEATFGRRAFAARTAAERFQYRSGTPEEVLLESLMTGSG